ncbi:hypothetical protein BBP40_008301 [Aspergillus hancockii]|nr:hypothetical protein BBP40_008301 [Aspergillus hancockii]
MAAEDTRWSGQEVRVVLTLSQSAVYDGEKGRWDATAYRQQLKLKSATPQFVGSLVVVK